MNPAATSWLIATGQAWKLYVALAGFGGALVLFSLALFSLASGGSRFVAFVACGGFLSVATFGWFTTVVRCPHCASRLVWRMVTSRPHSSWVIELAALDCCPVCGKALVTGRRPQ